jgi:hypothetical protein
MGINTGPRARGWVSKHAAQNNSEIPEMKKMPLDLPMGAFSLFFVLVWI